MWTIPEVISANQTLETGTNGSVPVVRTELDCLVDPSITVT